MSSAAVSAALDAELRALSTVSLQLNHCVELLRRRSVPRVTVLLWLATRLDDASLTLNDITEFSNFCFSALPSFVLPASLRDVAFPTQMQFSTLVPPEAARLIVAMATATARLGSDLVAALVVPLQSTASMRALLWSLCVVVKPDAPPAHIVHTVADALLAQLARAGTADLQRVDDLPRWSADLLASALTHAPLAPLAESAAAALLDDAYAGRRPLLDVVLLFRRVVPLVRGAVPRLRALLADRAALLHLFALERVSPTPTAVESVVDVLASSSDALVPLADDLVRAAASSLADDTLRPIALAVLRGACLQLAGIDFVAPTRTPLLAALKPSLLPLLVQLIGAGGDDALLDSLVAVVAGSRDSEAATALTCAAAQRDAQLFVLLLNRWYRAFPDLVRSVLAAGLVQNEYAPQLALLARIAVANPSPIGAAVRASVRTQCSVLVEQLARADEHEASALACFALLRSAFSIVDDGESCDAFGDASAHGQVHRLRALRDALCQLRLAAHTSHAVELVKLFVADVVLRDVEPNSVAMIVAADSLVALAAPLADERVATAASVCGATRLASALPQGSLLLAACERHKRSRMHSGAALANSASTLFSGKEFVKPAARAPRPAAAAAPPAYEAGDELGQHALDLLQQVCATDKLRRLAAVRSALVHRANVAAGILPLSGGASNGGAGSGGGGGSGGAVVPPTPAHEGATSAPPTPSQKRDEQPPAESMQTDTAATTLSCAWTTAGVPGGDAVGHTTARRLCDWLNGAPRLLDVVRLVACDAAAFQRERVLVMLVQSGLAIHGRRLAAGARSEFELRRLAGVCRQLGWTSASLAALAEQCSHEDVRDVIAALRETLGDAAAANAQANVLSVGALEHGGWEAVFRARSIEWR